jgi:acyl-CoA reductase-like NAD-dependent aldehyde dehydrogenase
MTRFLPQRLSLAQAGAQTAACGDATLPQTEKGARQVSGSTFSSTEVTAIFHLQKFPKFAVTKRRPAKERARFLADFAVTIKEHQSQIVLTSTLTLELIIVLLDLLHVFC